MRFLATLAVAVLATVAAQTTGPATTTIATTDAATTSVATTSTPTTQATQVQTVADTTVPTTVVPTSSLSSLLSATGAPTASGQVQTAPYVYNTGNTTQVPNCPPGNDVCYVLAPYRLEAPWAGSNQAWPQCYDPSLYVCSGGDFLCPIPEPIQCGQGCFSTNTSTCQVNSTDYYNSKVIKKSDVSPASTVTTGMAVFATATAAVATMLL